jgi:hypothetical protein
MRPPLARTVEANRTEKVASLNTPRTVVMPCRRGTPRIVAFAASA